MYDQFSVYRVTVTAEDLNILRQEFKTYPNNDDMLFVYYEDEVFGEDIPKALSKSTQAFIYNWENNAESFGDDFWVCFTQY